MWYGISCLCVKMETDFEMQDGSDSWRICRIFLGAV